MYNNRIIPQERPNRLFASLIMYLTLCVSLFSISLIDFSPIVQDVILLTDKVNSAEDFTQLFKTIYRIEETHDEKLIHLLMDNDRRNVQDLIRMNAFSFEGGGLLFSDVSAAFTHLIRNIDTNPELLDALTTEQLTALIKGLVTFDAKHFNYTVVPGGVLEKRSAVYSKQLVSELIDSANKKRDEILLIKHMTTSLRASVMNVIDAQHVSEVNNAAHVSEWLRSFLSDTATRELLRMLETLVRFLRVTHTIHMRIAVIDGHSYTTATLIWLGKMWTGYGISVTALLVYMMIVAYFLFHGSLFSIVYHHILQRYSTSGWCIYVKSILREIFVFQPASIEESTTSWPLLLCFVVAFIISNVFSLVVTWVVLCNYTSDELGPNLYMELKNRMHVKDIMEEELFNLKTTQTFFVLLITCMMEFLFISLAKRGLTRFDYYFFRPADALNTNVDARIYDDIVMRLGIASYVSLLVRSNDLYSWVWKRCFHVIDHLLQKFFGFPFPIDPHMNEMNGLVAWIASVWTIKALQ